MKLSIQKQYFTKEFLGFEIESKWELLTFSPVTIIIQFANDLERGRWHPFIRQKNMGNMPTNIRYFKFDFLFFGIFKNETWRQVAMAAKSGDLYCLAFKSDKDIYRHSEMGAVYNPPIIRAETRSGDWVEYPTMMEQLVTNDNRTKLIGKTTREKCSLFITNSETHRNYNVAADISFFETNVLCQIEIEYKGRNGLWLPDRTGKDIIMDYKILHNVFKNSYGNILKATKKRKFDWIIDQKTR